jgi:hypothetical protein
MWIDFTKKIIPQTPILSSEDMIMYKAYLKEIGYTPITDNNVTGFTKKGKSNNKKSFNRTPKKIKA